MDIERKYDVFGREVGFKEITPIKRVFQPGMLDTKTFFDSGVVDRIRDFNGYSSDNLFVYFRA